MASYASDFGFIRASPFGLNSSVRHSVSKRLMALDLAAWRSEPLPAFDNAHGWVLGKTFCIVGWSIVAGQAAIDGLADQRDQVVAGVDGRYGFPGDSRRLWG